jgi:hypothetical protein
MVLGLSTVIVLPNIDKGMRERNVRQSALALAAAARDLRSQALFKGIPQQLVLDVAQNSYLVARGREVQLPTDVKFTEIEGGESLDGGVRQFVFFPNGSTLGGQIDLSGGATATPYSIRFHPLTGKIEVLRGDKS